MEDDLLMMDLSLDVSGGFGEWAEESLFDQDEVRHELDDGQEEQQDEEDNHEEDDDHAMRVDAEERPPDAVEESAFEKFCGELSRHCERVAAALGAEVGRAGWAVREKTAGAAAASEAAGARVRGAASEAERVEESTLLLPGALGALERTREELRVLAEQASIFEREAKGGKSGWCPGKLLLGGAGGCVKKEGTLGELWARVLTGARCRVRAAGPVVLAADNGLPMAGATAAVDGTGMARFGEARFGAGSGGKVVLVRATLAVEWEGEGGRGKGVLASETVAYVVTTTEGQWSAAVGKLMAGKLFGERAAVPWALAANRLQRVYLESTRQDERSCKRVLSPMDLAYVHQFKFDSAPSVSPAAFERFWAWFGPILMSLRHSRLLLALWHEGYLMGFISKRAAETLLTGRAPGTFLLRFSERSAGSFAVAYVKQRKDGGPHVVKHYLLRHGDVAPPQRTLADFLGSQQYFVYLLKTIPTARTDTARWRLVHKDKAFGRYYGERGRALDGYEDQVGEGD